MRLPRLLLPILALSFGFTLAACSGADDPPRVTTSLDCATATSCTLKLGAPSSFTVTLVSNSCDAINNEISIISPFDSVLTSDACREPDGEEWAFDTPPGSPYPTNTEINLEFASDQFANTPGLRVEGDFATGWTIRFEDGGDTDFNDVILSVVADPVS